MNFLKKMNNFFLHTAGGLGDHLLGYFSPHSFPFGFGYLQELKTKIPEAKIKLICHPVQKEASRFFELDPRIDSIDIHPWISPLKIKECKNIKEEAKKYKSLEEFGKRNNLKKQPNIDVFLSKKEQETIDRIQQEGRYIVIHPFAGGKNRIFFSPENYIPFIDMVVEEKDLNVVIVGGSHAKIRNSQNPKFFEEKFSYQRKRLFNLVGKTTGRAAVKLTRAAEFLLASNSAFFCSVSDGCTKTVVFHERKDVFAKKVKKRFYDASQITILQLEKSISKEKLLLETISYV